MSFRSGKILITGAAGFLGQQLAKRLLDEPSAAGLVLTDVVPPPVPAGSDPEHIQAIAADLSNRNSLESVIAAAQPLAAVFVFHGIMSSGSEANPSLSLRVNLDATRALIFALAETNPGVRVIYASSQAVYGPPLPDLVTDATTATPASVYGTHKLMTEVMINDLHRRGLVDAFSLRFPTVSVRAGKPTQAASSFLSGMIREPMNGEQCVIPIEDRSYSAVLSTPSTLVENLVRTLKLPSNVLPNHIRNMNFPGVAVTVQELIDALSSVGGKDKLALLKEESDPVTERILRSWPKDVDCSTALALGLTRDKDAVAIVEEYLNALRKP